MAPDQFATLMVSGSHGPNSEEELELNGLNGGQYGSGNNGEGGEEDEMDGAKRKVRHNLTERRRVDRMNQLFKKLYMAIEDTAPPQLLDTAERLSVCGADGKPINPNKWSKADVLEGALNIIVDLRRQLDQECLARTLGLPVEEDDMEIPDDMSTMLQTIPSLSEL